MFNLRLRALDSKRAGCFSPEQFKGAHFEAQTINTSTVELGLPADSNYW